MKYIDAEKLKAEIERRRLSNRYIDTVGYENELFDIIESLQQEQPEVDLEKEIDIWIAENENIHRVNKLTGGLLKDIALKFYGLGLNARKEK